MSWKTQDKNEAITTEEKQKGSFAIGREAYLAKRKIAQERNKNYLCVGIWGAPKSAKTIKHTKKCVNKNAKLHNFKNMQDKQYFLNIDIYFALNTH